jgi:hypothetical protein
MACRTRPRRRSTALSRIWFATTFGVLISACTLPPIAGSSSAPGANLPPDVERLRGLSAADLERLLGEPEFVRQEPPAVIWQYRSAECVLDLFLYRSADELRVAYAEAHDRGVVRVSQSDCYAGLIASRARPL